MPVVLVHGNPETTAIWEPLRAELGRDDVIALSPPGFGAPVPEGFGATADDYRDWLIAELEGLSGPIDLIGHDWGGGHVQRVAAARPDLIRSWATDIAGTADPAYEWHELERAERRPGLVIIATEDPYTGGEALARRSAERFGAHVAVLEGLGHWWMLQDPPAATTALRRFLDTLP